jgi:hypothetical protein
VAELTATVNVAGLESVFQKALQVVRGEVVKELNAIAQKETDGRVQARLAEISMTLNMNLVSEEAKLVAKNAPISDTPRMGQTLLKSGQKPLADTTQPSPLKPVV